MFTQSPLFIENMACHHRKTMPPFSTFFKTLTQNLNANCDEISDDQTDGHKNVLRCINILIKLIEIFM